MQAGETAASSGEAARGERGVEGPGVGSKSLGIPSDAAAVAAGALALTQSCSASLPLADSLAAALGSEATPLGADEGSEAPPSRAATASAALPLGGMTLGTEAADAAGPPAGPDADTTPRIAAAAALGGAADAVKPSLEPTVPAYTRLLPPSAVAETSSAGSGSGKQGSLGRAGASAAGVGSAGPQPFDLPPARR